MEGGPFSKLGSRLSAAHIRFENVQQFQGWRAARFQNVALALAPRTLVLNNCSNFKDGWRLVFNMGAFALAPRTFLEHVKQLHDGGRLVFKM